MKKIKKIFDNFNLEVKQGEHIALLGRSGVGKSTLAGLIRGDLVPQSGSIQFSGVEPSKAKNVEEKKLVSLINPLIFLRQAFVLI